MVATAYQTSPEGSRRAGAMPGLAFGLALVVLCLAPSAKADALSAGERAFARQDYAGAAPVLLVEAERGVATAQTYVGYMYQNGLGVPRNYAVAARWLNQAAEQGEPTGQFLLGLLFDKGFGVPQDWVAAEVWLILAAAHAGGTRQQEYFGRVRDAVAQKLTLDQLAEAQRQAASWAPIVGRNFGPFSARY